MKKLNIIYEDKEIIVIDKPTKKLTISDGKSLNTLYHEVRTYLNRKKEKAFIVHRLDKDTSGVILFAKNERLKNYLQNNWNNIAINREYVSLVEGKMAKKKETLKNYLKETKTYEVYVTNDKKDTEEAITKYEVLKENNKYSLLKINIETGKKNQIRAQLAYINHPICGDKKYGSKTNPLGRLALHANKLEIKMKNKTLKFISEMPCQFDLF